MADFFAGPLPGQVPTAPAYTQGPSGPSQWTPTDRPLPAGPPGWPPYQGSSMSGGVLAIVIVGCVIGAFIVIGILAAIAIPVFLNQRAKAEAASTTVTIPEQLAGMARLHDDRSLRLEQQLRSQPGNPQVGVYGTAGSIGAAVSITRHAMTSREDDDFLGGAEGSFQSQGVGGVVFADVEPGHLGGRMRCAIAPGGQFSVCVFADHGAYGSITLFGDKVGQTPTALDIREAVEHRR